ncbi:heavy-metal-associated domain-containing protein [Magnetococcales bacterium HHB-1]
MTKQQGYPITHRFIVKGMVDKALQQRISDELIGLKGMLDVRSSVKKRTVKVTYDLHQLRFETIENHLKGIGFQLGSGLMARLKREMIHFTETNELDHLNHIPHCCSKPPTP